MLEGEPPNQKPQFSGKPVFFKGNRSEIKEDKEAKNDDAATGKPKNRNYDDLTHVCLTDEVVTKDDLIKKIEDEAEIENYEEGRLDREWYDAEEGGASQAVDEETN